MQKAKKNILIRDIDKSLKNGPVIRKKGNKQNNKAGILIKNNNSAFDL